MFYPRFCRPSRTNTRRALVSSPSPLSEHRLSTDGEGSPAVSVRDRRPDRLKTTAFEARRAGDRREGEAPMSQLDKPDLWAPRSEGRAPSGQGGLDDSVYQRLLRERIIFLGQRSTTTSPTRSARSCCCSPPRTPTRTSTSTSTRPAARSTAGMAIYDTMQFVKNDVATVAMGLAASMGQFLLCAGAPGKRYALPHARIMMHQPSGGIGGTASRHRDPGRADALHQADDGRADRLPHRPDRRADRGATPTATAGSPPRRPRTTASSTTSSPAPARSPAAAARPDRRPRPSTTTTPTTGDRAQLQRPARAAVALRPALVRRAHVATGIKRVQPVQQAVRGAHHLPRRADRRRLGQRRHGAAAVRWSRWTPTATSRSTSTRPAARSPR